LAKGQGFSSHPEVINRKGRPKKGHTLTDILEKELRKKIVTLKGTNGVPRMISGREAAVHKIVELALGGNFNALKYIFDRIDGFPTARIEQEMALPDKIELVSEYEDERLTPDAGADTPEV
jgi:hypothetical protein